MYQVKIKTKYNTINLKIDDIKSDEFKELIEQDYVVEVKIERIKTKEELIKIAKDRIERNGWYKEEKQFYQHILKYFKEV